MQATQNASRTFANLDPATGELIENIPVADQSAITAAVERARAAQSAWADLSIEERSALLEKGAARLGERAEEIAKMATREMGKLYEDALRETKSWATYTAKTCEEVREALKVQVIPGKGEETRVVREAHGVVAAITPWNFPVSMPLSILIPALAAGNTVVFKPSEHVPLTGALIAECYGPELPPGVLELIQGEGDVGAALVAADVDMIGFVGSRDTGVRIMKSASEGLKRLVLELGGKDPLVVFADADLEEAAECAVRHSLRNTGQVCCAVERVYVAESVAKPFEALVVEKAKTWQHGSGFEESSKMGPMVSELQRSKVAEQVDDARQKGARVLLGGELPKGDAGWFYPATVVADVKPGQRVHDDETFGPVVCLSVFDGSDDQAVELANDTPYGLGASVYTADLERGERVAGRIRSGQIGVNRYLGGAPGTPWVGARQSGFGFLGGKEGHLQFTTPKTITVKR